MTEAGVSFAGNSPTTPELWHTEAGIARAMVRVAISGRREQEASFFIVVVWRDQAEHAARSLSRGSRVVVLGRLQQRSWTADDGSARSVAEELGAGLTGGPWWRHLSGVPANSRCRRAIASEPGLRKAKRSSRGPTVRDALRGTGRRAV